ncbi:ABC transporter permease [Tengunoibacter tsumagoiensis]|uniref:Oligopeptide transport system permease protein AppC n=1 Tax=Tengunoibacter tsumagoiensis TaxID=2014871 RepID=A0A401ZXP1_9CHLR|nr:ABC transporter permease [Tengunoibacter tsumagoiensis]GCE11626.1 oligopeptide transport system permease protein AppC [Tengunoibacter tsumagoiensis]
MEHPDDSKRTFAIDEEELEPALDLAPVLLPKRRSQIRIIFDRFTRNKVALAGSTFLVFLFLFCFLGPVVTGHTLPDIPHPDQALQPPNLTYPLGTDNVGRDQFARAMYGGQVSLLVGLSSMFVALVFGVCIGAVAGFYGGIIENILMRLTDVMLAIPTYLLLFVLALSFSDGSPLRVVLFIAIFSWATAARVVRGEFLALKEREYVLAARTIGAKNLRLMFRHILPNAAGPIIVNATLLIGSNIILESILSYFSFGLHPPTASWGNLVSDGQGLYDSAPWLVFTPTLLIFFTVLSCNLVGDGLRDALDPYMTER